MMPSSASQTFRQEWRGLFRHLAAAPGVFAQERSAQRALEIADGLMLAPGRSTISCSIAARGLEDRDWSADYYLLSRAPCDLQAFFDGLMLHLLCEQERIESRSFVAVAVDDTRLHKTGRQIPGSHWFRDPLSPKFHTNLVWGQRFLQMSYLVPRMDAQEAAGPTRGIPVRFVHAPCPRRPRKNASAEVLKAYVKAKAESNLSLLAHKQALGLVQAIGTSPAQGKPLLLIGDGGFCNRTFFAQPVEEMQLLTRCRKDALLCHQASEGSRRFYGAEKFRPEELRLNEAIPWQETEVYFAGAQRQISYKEQGPILWQGGARRRPLRLIVLRPTAYIPPGASRKSYRQPAYLLTTDLQTPTNQLIQAYIDRWEIEVNHREEKTALGVGQAQVWSPKSADRAPALLVAAYAVMLTASLKLHGLAHPPNQQQQHSPDQRSPQFPRPKWRTNAKRPSINDLARMNRAAAYPSQQNYPKLR